MADARGKLGESYVEIRADTSKLRTDLQAAQTEVATESEKIGAAVERDIGGGFEQVGKKIQENTAGVRRFASSISSVAGVWTSMLGVVTLVGTALAAIVAAADKWLDSSKKTTEELQREYRTIADIEDAMKRREAVLDGLSEKQRAILDLTQALRKDEERLADLRDKGEISAEKQRELLERTREITRREIQEVEALDAARVKMRAQEYEDFLRTEAAKTEAAKKAEEERASNAAAIKEKARQDEEAKALAAAERQAAAFATAMERAIGRMNTGQMFQQQIAGPLEEILRDIQSSIDNLKFGSRF